MAPYWKMDDFGGVGVAGLAGAWLAGRATPISMANSTPKSMAIPRLISEAKSRKLLEVVKDVQNLKSVF